MIGNKCQVDSHGFIETLVANEGAKIILNKIVSGVSTIFCFIAIVTKFLKCYLEYPRC